MCVVSGAVVCGVSGLLGLAVASSTHGVHREWARHRAGWLCGMSLAAAPAVVFG